MTPVRTSGLIFTGYSAQEGIGISVSAKTLAQVKAGAIDEGNIIKRIWNAVREFFSPSDRAQAKLALVSFYSENSTDQEKIEGFYKLKELAGFENGDFLKPEVSYHAKPQGGFYKAFDLRINIDGLEHPVERLIDRDCVESDEIFNAYASSVSSEEDRQLFESCLKILYARRNSSNAGYERRLDVQGAVLGLFGVVLRNPGVGMIVGLSNDSIEYKGGKFPPLGASKICNCALEALGAGAAEKERLKSIIDPHLPAPISINQRSEAIKVLNRIVESDLKGLPKAQENYNEHALSLNHVHSESLVFEEESSMLSSLEDEWGELPSKFLSYSSIEHFETCTSLRVLLGVVYSHRTSVEDKYMALLDLQLKLNDSEQVKFEISEVQAGRVGQFSPKIVKIRMSFPGEENLSAVEISKVEVNKHSFSRDAGLRAESTYVPWNGGWSSAPPSGFELSSSGALSPIFAPIVAPEDSPVRPVGMGSWIKR